MLVAGTVPQVGVAGAATGDVAARIDTMGVGVGVHCNAVESEAVADFQEIGQ